MCSRKNDERAKVVRARGYDGAIRQAPAGPTMQLCFCLLPPELALRCQSRVAPL